LDYKIALLFLLVFLTSTSTFAELRDPTKPAYFSSDIATAQQPGDELKLSSIWSSGKSRRATINGVTAREGETIFSDIKIIKIYNNAVKIKQNSVTRKLTLLTRSYKTK